MRIPALPTVLVPNLRWYRRAIAAHPQSMSSGAGPGAARRCLARSPLAALRAQPRCRREPPLTSGTRCEPYGGNPPALSFYKYTTLPSSSIPENGVTKDQCWRGLPSLIGFSST